MRRDPERVLRAKVLDKARGHLDDVLSRCESPIERVFLLGWISHCAWDGWTPTVKPSDLPGDEVGFAPGFRFKLGGLTAHIVPQVTIQTRGGRYRIDFAVRHQGGDDAPLFFAIECDGHDFHERTKQQAARDKQRDRWLQAAGWRVLRFTGSEVWRDAEGVAASLRQVISEAALGEIARIEGPVWAPRGPPPLRLVPGPLEHSPRPRGGCKSVKSRKSKHPTP